MFSRFLQGFPRFVSRLRLNLSDSFRTPSNLFLDILPRSEAIAGGQRGAARMSAENRVMGKSFCRERKLARGMITSYYHATVLSRALTALFRCPCLVRVCPVVGPQLQRPQTHRTWGQDRTVDRTADITRQNINDMLIKLISSINGSLRR